MDELLKHFTISKNAKEISKFFKEQEVSIGIEIFSLMSALEDACNRIGVKLTFFDEENKKVLMDELTETLLNGKQSN